VCFLTQLQNSWDHFSRENDVCARRAWVVEVFSCFGEINRENRANMKVLLLFWYFCINFYGLWNAIDWEKS
jgi:hypothetical protein